MIHLHIPFMIVFLMIVWVKNLSEARMNYACDNGLLQNTVQEEASEKLCQGTLKFRISYILMLSGIIETQQHEMAYTHLMGTFHYKGPHLTQTIMC